MPGFQHYVSGVPEPFCHCRPAVTVLSLPETVIPFPFRVQATELDGNHFPLTMNVKQRLLLLLVWRRRMKYKRRKHRFWIRQICCSRFDFGEFNLFREMYHYDHESFFRYFRMTVRLRNLTTY